MPVVIELTLEEEIDNDLIKRAGLNQRGRKALDRMFTAHTEKIPRVQPDLDRLNDVDGYSGRLYELMEQGMNRGQARNEANSEKDFYQAKVDKLIETVRMIKVEQG
ncbi:hypothetical protein LCGC14_2584550, partial [marine sediment metagenome]